MFQRRKWRHCQKKRIETLSEEKIGILPEEKASLSIINSINDRKKKKPQFFNEKKGMQPPNEEETETP